MVSRRRLVFKLGHRAEAIGCFRRAAATEPKTAFGRLGKARALLAEDRDEEAERTLRQLLALCPGNDARYAPKTEMEKAWKAAKTAMFTGKSNKADSEDSYTLNHLIWYEATGFKRPYPGETKVRAPSAFGARITGPVRGD